MALGRGAARLAQHAGVPLEPVGNLPDGEHGHARRGQLDREWHPVQPSADPPDAVAHAGRVEIEPARRLRGALDEQRHRAVVGVLVGLGVVDRVGIGDREPADAPHLLAGDAQGLTAGGDQPERLRAFEQGDDELGATVGHLLAVVEGEQCRFGEPVSERCGRGIAGQLSLQNGGGHDLRNEVGIERRRQVDPPRSADEVRPHRVRERDRKPRLARAARTTEGQHASAPHQRLQLAQRGISPDEPCELDRQVPERVIALALLARLGCGFLDQKGHLAVLALLPHARLPTALAVPKV